MNVYEIVTSWIVKELESGTVPWKKSWSTGGLPRNLLSNKAYRGINPFLLGLRGYASSNWLTLKQAKTLKLTLKDEQEATPVIFWKWYEKKGKGKAGNGASKGEGEKRYPVLRYYRVFNLTQFEGELETSAEQAPEELPRRSG